MEFSVNTSALVGLSDLMDRRWADFESGRSYLKNNAHFSVFNRGVLNAIWESTRTSSTRSTPSCPQPRSGSPAHGPSR